MIWISIYIIDPLNVLCACEILNSIIIESCQKSFRTKRIQKGVENYDCLLSFELV